MKQLVEEDNGQYEKEKKGSYVRKKEKTQKVEEDYSENK